MTKPIDPYSRVYWKIFNDDRFDEVRSDMRHFGSWALMLLVADMSYPAPAFVPPTVPKASLRKLLDVGLVETLKGGLFHVHGLAAERAKRSPRGADSEPAGNPAGPAPDRTGTGREPLARAIDETRRDETRVSRDEQNARDEISEGETDLFAFIAQHGAFIRPDSGFGVRLLGLIERRGAEVVMETARAMAGEPMSDRQWVFGLEKALEAIPSPPMEELLPDDSDSKRRYERMVAKRLEYFRASGKWHPEWGEVPAA